MQFIIHTHFYTYMEYINYVEGGNSKKYTSLDVTS